MIIVQAYRFDTGRSISMLVETLDIARSVQDFIATRPNIRFDGIMVR